MPGGVVALLSAFSAGVDGKPSQSAVDYTRSRFIEAGGDRVRSGLNVGFYAGLSVRLYPGWGIVGGIAFEVTSAMDFTSAGNGAGNQRWDRLVARRKWPSLEVELVIVQGVPAANPVLPALTRDTGGVWEFGLAQWVVPGFAQGTIDYGRVWDHYADDASRFSTDIDQSMSTGTTITLLAMTAPERDPLQFRVPGTSRVALDVMVSVRADGICGGTVSLQMAGLSRSVLWKAGGAGPFTITMPTFEAPISYFGGQVPAIVQISLEGAPNAATPLYLSRINARQYAVIR